MIFVPALAGSAAVDSGFVLVAIAAYKRYGVAAQVATPYHVGILSACALAQSAFLSRIHTIEEAIIFMTLTACIAASVVTDLAAGYVLDAVTVPGLTVAFFVAAIDAHLVEFFEAALSVAGAILLLYALSRGRGIGLGDAKLAACAGALLGGRDGLISLGFAFVLGGLHAAALLVFRGACGKQSVPFAPYVAAGIFIELTLRAA